jgi:hypothetical protein
MVEKIREAITEKTSVSFGVLFSILALSVGVGAWVRNVEARITRVESVGSDLESHREEDDRTAKALMGFVHSVDSRLSRIEGKLGINK